jgi:acyl-homoserine-lactone acylase
MGSDRRLSVRGWSGGVAAVCAGLMILAPNVILSAASARPAAAAVTSPVQVKTAPAGGRYVAEIRRTAYGIPHILARDFGSLGYGYGYAFAQDNLCVLASRVLALRGQRSRYFGPDADSGDPLAPATNLDSDMYYTSLRRSGIVRRLLAQRAPLGPTAQARALVDGYVAGYNRYLRATGVAHLPDPACRGAAWVTPITALDIWTGLYDVNELGGSAAFKDAIATAAPPTATAAATPARAATAALRAQLAGRRLDAGSNAYALGREATTNRDGMLLANPHFPWTGYGRFYQVQLTIPRVLNVSGASLYGTPTVEIGHTDGLAWSHTVSTAQRFTLYQLTLVPGHPTSYLVDGRREQMTSAAVTVTVRGSSGQLSTVSRTLYSSRYGPVLTVGPLAWSATTAFAIRDANARNVRSINEWIAMGKAENLTQLRQAQRTYQAIPFVNTIATDTSGTAYFADASVVPHVTDAQAARCVDTPLGKALFPQIFVLDGSTSACRWGSDHGAIEPGIFGPTTGPRLTRADYVTNSNDSAWLTNPAQPITSYPRIFGDIGTERSLRTRLGLDMVARRLASTDGLGPPGFTLASLQATTLGDRNHGGELARADAVAMCRAHPTLTASNGKPVDVRAACRVLARWDAHGNTGSRGEVLWRLFFDLAAQSVGDGLWRVPFDPAHPLSTPHGLAGSLPAVQRALADAVAFFQASKIPLDIPLGAAQKYAGIPLHGCTDLEGCFAVVEPGGPLTAGGTYPDVNFGSSFIMTVELTRAGPRAATILTYSESANTASPHHTDQTRLFAAKKWVPDRFTDAQINSDPDLSVTVVRG